MVPGLPIGDCASGYKGDTRPQMSAKNVTEKIFFQRLYVCTIFFPERPLIFLVISIHQVMYQSPGTITPPLQSQPLTKFTLIKNQKGLRAVPSPIQT